MEGEWGGSICNDRKNRGLRELFLFSCKRLRSPGIDSGESIQPAYVAWRASTTNRVVVPARQAGNRFLGTLKGLQIRVLFAAHHFRAPLVFFLPANAGQFLSLSLGHPDNPGRKQAKIMEKNWETEVPWYFVQKPANPVSKYDNYINVAVSVPDFHYDLCRGTDSGFVGSHCRFNNGGVGKPELRIRASD
jgi:hypothetical protein